MKCIVEVVCVGNELLIGKVVNTNAQWLARSITSLGGYIRRISVVGDVLDEISSVLMAALSREPSFIITTGGLGPTFDDITLESIAKMLKIPLSINEKALTMVMNKYRQYEAIDNKKIELTPARLKMATLPKGATPLHNPVGTAPGVFLALGKSKMIALPGVPREVEAIFEASVKPLIIEAVGNVFICEKTLNVTRVMESAIAPLLDETIRENPHVYIKSHPKISEHHPLLELHLMTTFKSKKTAEKMIEASAEKMAQLIREHGGKIVGFATLTSLNTEKDFSDKK